MLNCREVADDADRLLADDLPWRRRIAIRSHLLVCRHCRLYVRQLKVLMGAVSLRHTRASDEEVARIIERIDSRSD